MTRCDLGEGGEDKVDFSKFLRKANQLVADGGSRNKNTELDLTRSKIFLAYTQDLEAVRSPYDRVTELVHRFLHLADLVQRKLRRNLISLEDRTKSIRRPCT